MTIEQIFGVLKISVTKDIDIIKSAYRAELANNHPEDDPAGFKLLREAYEKALEYAETEDGASWEDYRGTPIGDFVNGLQVIYSTLSKRLDVEGWREFLAQEIFDDLEEGERARKYLFTYLAENFRLTNAVYRLLDKRFGIEKNADEYKEYLPQAFVDYMIGCINDADDRNEFPYLWLDGGEDADYDSFISDLSEAENQIYSGNYDGIDEKTARLKAYGIYHPYHELVKGYAYCNKGLFDEAYGIAEKIVQTEEYRNDIKIQSCVGEILWQSGHIEEGLEVFRRMEASGADSFIKRKYLGIAALEGNNYREAVFYLGVFENSTDEKTAALLKAADRGFILKYEASGIEAIQGGAEETDTADLLVHSYMRRDEHEKALAFLMGNEIYKDKLFTYHRILSVLYEALGRTEKALHEDEKWIKRLEEKKEEAQRNGDIQIIMACEYELAKALLIKAGLLVSLSQNVKESKRAAYYEKAMEALKTADEIRPEQAAPKINMANLEMLCGEYRKAYENGIKALESDASLVPALEVTLWAAYETNHAQDVIDLFCRMININPGYVQAYEYAALIFLEYDQKSDAENILEEAERQGLECLGLEVLKLKLAYMREKDSQGSNIYGKYLKLIDDMILKSESKEKGCLQTDKRFLAELYYMKSDLVSNDKENEHHISEIKDPALKAASLCRSRRYIYNAAHAHRANSDYKKALELLEEYEKMCEPEAGIYLDMIECLDFTDQWDKTAPVMEKAQKAAGNNPNIYKWLGMIHDHHARRTGAADCHYDVIKYWKLYLEKAPEMAPLAHIKIADAAFVLDEWDIAIDHLKAALDENWEAAEKEADVKDKEDICVKLVSAYIYKRDFNHALHYTDFLSREGKNAWNYYHFRGLIYEKLMDYEAAAGLYREGIGKCSDYDRFDLAGSLRLLYMRRRMYQEALMVLDEVQKNTYSEKMYVYNRLKLERAMAKTDKEKRSVAKALRRAMNRYEIFELKSEMINMRIYDFGDMEHFYEQKLAMLEEKLQNGPYIKKYYENLGDIAECMALAWDRNDEEGLKALAFDFKHGLDLFYGNDKRRTPIEHYLANDSDGLENMCRIMMYYICTGQTDKADALIEEIEGKALCAFCTVSICTDRLQSLGMYYQAKGNEKLAYEYYRAAVEHGSVDKFANYKIASTEK